MLSEEIKDIIRVECYSGYKADERPVHFLWRGRKFVVEKVIDQWRSPDSDNFKVLADDGKGYLLLHDNVSDQWVLEKIFEHEEGLLMDGNC